MTNEPQNSPDYATNVFEQALAKQKIEKTDKYILYLYIAGTTPNCIRALKQLRQLCEKHLAGNYEVKVIDIYEHPELAESEQIVAIPTLIKKLPPPLRKFIGDLSNQEKILIGLDIW